MVIVVAFNVLLQTLLTSHEHLWVCCVVIVVVVAMLACPVLIVRALEARQLKVSPRLVQHHLRTMAGADELLTCELHDSKSKDCVSENTSLPP